MSHQLTKRTLRACRAVTRLIATRTEGWDEAEAADHQVDGGEWSGPAWDNNRRQLEEDVVRLVAERYELPQHYLMECLVIYENEELGYFWRAVTPIEERPFRMDNYSDEIGDLI